MTAAEAKLIAQTNKANNPNDDGLLVESYIKWINGRISTRIKDGRMFVSPVFDGMNRPPSAKRCKEIEEILVKDGYKVAKDEQGIINKVSWD